MKSNDTEWNPIMRSFACTEDRMIGFSLGAALAAIPFFSLIFVFIKGEEMSTGFLVYCSMFVVFVVFLAFFFIDTTDLLVNETGVARRIGGRVCMQVPWSQIQQVREILRPKVRNAPQIVIQVIPTVRRGALLRFRRMIVISEQFEHFNDLVEILNTKITQRSIQVEVNSNGIWSRRSRLEANCE